MLSGLADVTDVTDLSDGYFEIFSSSVITSSSLITYLSFCSQGERRQENTKDEDARLVCFVAFVC